MNSRTLLWPLLALGLLLSGCSGSGSGGSGGEPAPAPAPAPNAAKLPQLPQAQVDVTMPIITIGGITCNATTASEFSSCLTTVAAASLSLNHEIVLTAGAAYDGNFTLPGRSGATGWVVIRSSAIANLPVGTRVSSSQASSMPRIRTTSTDTAAIHAASNASHYRLVGLEVTQSAVAHMYNLVTLGEASNGIVNTGYVIVDRCYIHGLSTSETRRGVNMDLRLGTGAVIESFIENIHETGADSQTILAIENPGPILIQNNDLSAAGEVVLFGGGDPSSVTYLPQDITIKRNYLHINPAWKGTTSWSVKTIIEFKLGKRVLMEGNILEYSWPGDIGYGWRLTVRNQGGNAPFADVSDITIRYNTTAHVGKGFNFLGTDNDQPSLAQKHWLIEHNLWYDMGGQWSNGSNNFWVWTGPSSPATDDIVFRHNTVINATAGAFLYTGPSGQTNFTFQDNIIHHGDYGVYRDGGVIGTQALNAQWGSSYTFTKNLIVGMAAAGHNLGEYPAGNFTEAAFSNVGFVNLGANDYHLAASSLYKAGHAGQASDGTDLGANITALEAAQAGGGGSSDITPPAAP